MLQEYVSELDILIVDADEVGLSTHPHQRADFDVFTSQMPSSCNQDVRFGTVFKELFAEQGHIIPVAGVDHLTVRMFRQQVHEILMKPLPKRGILSSNFQNLLRHNPSPEDTARSYLSFSVQGSTRDELFAYFADLEFILNLVGSIRNFLDYGN